MTIMVLSASPNKDGLTAACVAAAIEGVRLAEAEADAVRLSLDALRETDVAYQGASVLGNVQAAQLTITTAWTWGVYLPVIMKP